MAGKNRFLRLSGFFLIALALLLGLYTLVAYLGWQSGETLRVERIQTERTTALETQVAHARDEIAAGNYRLALRRLAWVLEMEPGHTDARSLQEEAERALASSSVPTPTSAPTGSPTATLTPAGLTPTPVDDDAPAEAFQALEAMVEAEAWEDAIVALVDFQSEYPNYERRESDRLLYEAYIGRGIELLYGERVELGLYYLAQAEILGDLPQEVRDQRQWARLYLNGIAYYGVNWNVAIFNFRELCLAAPFYQNACERLHTALIAYADQFAFGQDWCSAESFYAEAYRLERGDGLGEKLSEAREGCQNATPTATAPLTDTLRFPDS
jgi:hypothetical protein